MIIQNLITILTVAIAAQASAPLPDASAYIEKLCGTSVVVDSFYSKVRCYYDGEGNLHHWLFIMSVENNLPNVHEEYLYRKKHGVSPPAFTDRFRVGYSMIRDRQEAYNDWMKTANCPNRVTDATDGARDADKVPACIYPSGTLNRRTLKIPYFRHLCEFATLSDRFAADCAHEEKLYSYDNSGCWYDRGWEFKNARLAVRAQALRELRKSLDDLRGLGGIATHTASSAYDYKYFGFSRYPLQTEYDHLDPEDLQAEDIAKLNSLEESVAAREAEVRLRQDAYEAQRGTE